MAVFNHVGALKNIPITGNRIFSYGEDIFHSVWLPMLYTLPWLSHVLLWLPVHVVMVTDLYPAGTGDLAAVYQELLDWYGPDTKFVGVGYSLGGCILIRFLGEDRTRQEHFLCAVSIGQGYDPPT